jgi:hypothetical protein
MTLITPNIIHFHKYNQEYLNLPPENKKIYYKNIINIIKKLNEIKSEICIEEYQILYSIFLSKIYLLK